MKRGPKTQPDIEGENPSQPKKSRAESNPLSENFERLTLEVQLPHVSGDVFQQCRDPFQKVLFSYLKNAELAAFSQACRQTREWTKEERETRAASPFLQYVVQGNQDEAQRILQSNPDLIFCDKGKAIDYSGKTIEGLTAFQAALCAGDVEMCVMMRDVCSTLEKGQEKLQKQYNEVFQQGIEAYSLEQENETFDFSHIIKAILAAPDDEVVEALSKQFDDSKPLHKALSTFRADFDKLSFDTQIFNPWHLHKAFTLYNDNFDAMQSWNKRSLIWRQVVGYTQRHLPACYAQSIAQGLYYIVETNEALMRRFVFRHLPSCYCVFPATDGDGIGFDFAASRHRVIGAPARADVRGSAKWLEKLFRAKTSILEQAFSARREVATFGV